MFNSEIYLTSISISSIFSSHFLIFFTFFLTLIHQIIIATAPEIRYIHTSTLNARVVNNELHAINSQIKANRIHKIRIIYRFSTFSFFISKLSIIIITHFTAIAIHNIATNTNIINSPDQGKHKSNNQINVVRTESIPTKVLSSNHGFLIAKAIPVIQKTKAQIAKVTTVVDKPRLGMATKQQPRIR